MKYILVNVENNYADEFDIEGFGLFSGEDAERALKLISLHSSVPDQELCFGTNESVYLRDTSFTVKELTEKEFDAILNVLGSRYGLFSVDYVLEAIEEGALFVEEREVFISYMFDLAHEAQFNGVSYWDFLDKIKKMKEFTAEGVHFYSTQYQSGMSFTVKKEQDGVEYTMVFNTTDYVKYF